MENNKAIKPFGFKDKIGYMFGDFGNDLTFLLSSSFLLKFYTDVMDVDAYVVGIIMMMLLQMWQWAEFAIKAK